MDYETKLALLMVLAPPEPEWFKKTNYAEQNGELFNIASHRVPKQPEFEEYGITDSDPDNFMNWSGWCQDHIAKLAHAFEGVRGSGGFYVELSGYYCPDQNHPYVDAFYSWMQTLYIQYLNEETLTDLEWPLMYAKNVINVVNETTDPYKIAKPKKND